mmetsp:Transcript_9132/g.13694  ORF Transcript_9132/g.13694 Transcript_9132/m.13694 type:complete len:1199 (+) Transcript_9132:72-3668(+)
MSGTFFASRKHISVSEILDNRKESKYRTNPQVSCAVSALDFFLLGTSDGKILTVTEGIKILHSLRTKHGVVTDIYVIDKFRRLVALEKSGRRAVVCIYLFDGKGRLQYEGFLPIPKPEQLAVCRMTGHLATYSKQTVTVWRLAVGHSRRLKAKASFSINTERDITQLQILGSFLAYASSTEVNVLKIVTKKKLVALRLEAQNLVALQQYHRWKKFQAMKKISIPQRNQSNSADRKLASSSTIKKSHTDEMEFVFDENSRLIQPPLDAESTRTSTESRENVSRMSATNNSREHFRLYTKKLSSGMPRDQKRSPQEFTVTSVFHELIQDPSQAILTLQLMNSQNSSGNKGDITGGLLVLATNWDARIFQLIPTTTLHCTYTFDRGSLVQVLCHPPFLFALTKSGLQVHALWKPHQFKKRLDRPLLLWSDLKMMDTENEETNEKLRSWQNTFSSTKYTRLISFGHSQPCLFIAMTSRPMATKAIFQDILPSSEFEVRNASTGANRKARASSMTKDQVYDLCILKLSEINSICFDLHLKAQVLVKEGKQIDRATDLMIQTKIMLDFFISQGKEADHRILGAARALLSQVYTDLAERMLEKSELAIAVDLLARSNSDPTKTIQRLNEASDSKAAKSAGLSREDLTSRYITQLLLHPNENTKKMILENEKLTDKIVSHIIKYIPDMLGHAILKTYLLWASFDVKIALEALEGSMGTHGHLSDADCLAHALLCIGAGDFVRAKTSLDKVEDATSHVNSLLRTRSELVLRWRTNPNMVQFLRIYMPFCLVQLLVDLSVEGLPPGSDDVALGSITGSNSNEEERILKEKNGKLRKKITFVEAQQIMLRDNAQAKQRLSDASESKSKVWQQYLDENQILWWQYLEACYSASRRLGTHAEEFRREVFTKLCLWYVSCLSSTSGFGLSYQVDVKSDSGNPLFSARFGKSFKTFLDSPILEWTCRAHHKIPIWLQSLLPQSRRRKISKIKKDENVMEVQDDPLSSSIRKDRKTIVEIKKETKDRLSHQELFDDIRAVVLMRFVHLLCSPQPGNFKMIFEAVSPMENKNILKDVLLILTMPRVNMFVPAVNIVIKKYLKSLLPFANHFAKKKEDWHCILDILWNQIFSKDAKSQSEGFTEISATNEDRRMALFNEYNDLLKRLSKLLSPDDLLDVLPEDGDVRYFLQAIQESCSNLYAQRTIGGMVLLTGTL